MALLEALSGRGEEAFAGHCFRATRATADATAFSPNGGRWAPPSTYLSVPVLYTSLERDGALAEVASCLALLDPVPSRRIVVPRLRVTARKVMRLTAADLGGSGQNHAGWGSSKLGEAPSSRSQEVGAALSFPGFDGLIAPPVRWPCDNLVLLGDDHGLACELEPVGREEVDWQAWMRDADLPAG